MTDLPEDDASEPVILSGGESAVPGTTPGLDAAQEPAAARPPLEVQATASAQGTPAFSYTGHASAEPPLFRSFTEPPVRRPARIPHFGHLLFLSLLLLVAFSVVLMVLGLASHFHLFGLELSAKSATDLGINVASETMLYLVTFVLCLVAFPLIWNEGFFAGLHWRGRVALDHFWLLIGTASACFGLAILDQVLMPGPANAPIEKMISSPGAAWLMFAFGVTMAPFFEEMFFRGFLLPALATVADWTDESLFARPGLQLTPRTRTALSVTAMLLVCSASLGVPVAILYAVFQVMTATGKYPVAIFTAAVIVGFALFGTLHSIRSSTADQQVRPLDANGNPQWSLAAMIVGSVLTSIPFALLHVAQQGHSLGPFLLLIVISLILCAVRLKTRSLAASTLVHASYNFLIFTIELAATSGFRHFDKM